MILFPCQVPSDLLHLPWKGVFLLLHSDVWPGFLRASTTAVAPFYFGTETWLSLDGFLWEWLYWSCPWCWAEYPAFQHRFGTPVGGTPSDGLILILTDVCMYAGFFVFPSLTFVLVFDTLRSPDVSGLASDEATLSPVACGGRSDCRAFSSFLVVFWTCVTHVHYLYRVWAFFICFLVLQRTVEWMALQSFRVDIIHLKDNRELQLRQQCSYPASSLKVKYESLQGLEKSLRS